MVENGSFFHSNTEIIEYGEKVMGRIRFIIRYFCFLLLSSLLDENPNCESSRIVFFFVQGWNIECIKHQN